MLLLQYYVLVTMQSNGDSIVRVLSSRQRGSEVSQTMGAHKLLAIVRFGSTAQQVETNTQVRCTF